jgi:hypothetical protein
MLADVTYGVLNNPKPCISELFAKQHAFKNELNDNALMLHESYFSSLYDVAFMLKLPLRLTKAGARIIDIKLASTCNPYPAICTALALIMYEMQT